MLERLRVFGFAGLIASGFVFSSYSAAAERLSELVPDLLRDHNLTQAAEADLAAARERVREAVGGWFPQLNVTAHYGYEDQNKPAADDTNLVTRELDVTVTQLLWDFDATPSSIRVSRLVRVQAAEALRAARQNLLLRGVVAYLNVQRAAEVLAFARRSEANIKRQTELENARVERGAGFSTDVLQAKTQLAGAQARRVRAEGALQVSRNAYRAVFYKDAGDIEGMVTPVLPVDLLPPTVEEVVEVSLANNPQLKAANLGAEIARETIRSTRASGFFPRLDAVGEAKYKKDVSSTIGFQRELVGKVQLSFPFNLGLTAVNSVRAARGTFVATQKRYADARDLIEEQARNSWENLRTAKGNAELLLNQANIAAEFLELARKERQLGRRSLLDVLNGETALINAQSDAASAQTDVAIAVFALLNVMGLLDEDVVAAAP